MASRHYALFAALLTCCIVGCGNDNGSTAPETENTASHDDHDDHDHGDHDDTIKPDEVGLNVDDLPGSIGPPMPENFAAAVAQLNDLVPKVAAGLAKGDVDSVHDELHDLGNAFENAESLAEASNQSDEVKAAIGTLFDAFTAVDSKLHGLEGKDFADVEDDIESAMDTLKTSAEN